jgi:hypothetical protein
MKSLLCAKYYLGAGEGERWNRKHEGQELSFIYLFNPVLLGSQSSKEVNN